MYRFRMIVVIDLILKNDVSSALILHLDEDQQYSQTHLRNANMIAYLIELAYDLAISPLDNISESPGFESCLIERKKE